MIKKFYSAFYSTLLSTLHWTIIGFQFCFFFNYFFSPFFQLLGTCGGRKRRSIQETIEEKFDFDVAPSQGIDWSAEDHNQDQPDSGLKNDEQLMENESQRYFYYHKKILFSLISRKKKFLMK